MPANMLKPVVLKNGMMVLRVPRSGMQTCIVGFIAKTGSANESDHFPQGLSYLIERMFWKGTDKHPSLRSLNQALESMGGEFYSHTGRELTQYYLKVPSYQQYKAISMMAEIVQHSYFQDHDIDQEKQLIVEEIKQFEETLRDESELAQANFYGRYGLGQSIKGTVESVLTITQEHIVEYLAHQYSPSNCVLVLSGNFDTKSTFELVEQEWALWSPRTLQKIPAEPFEPAMVGKLPRMNFLQRGVPNTQISLGFLLDGGLEPTYEEGELEHISPERLEEDVLSDWSKLLVLNALLGQGLSSRLWLKCVEDEMFFGNISSQLVLFSKTGYVHIGGTTNDNSQFTFALESVLSTLEAIKKTTISINEFTKAKEYIRSRLIIEHDDLLAATIWQVEILLLSGLQISKDDLLEYIKKVDVNVIRSLAMDLFVPERMALTTLGTAKQSTLVQKLIKKYLT